MKWWCVHLLLDTLKEKIHKNKLNKATEREQNQSNAHFPPFFLGLADEGIFSLLYLLAINNEWGE